MSRKTQRSKQQYVQTSMFASDEPQTESKHKIGLSDLKAVSALTSNQSTFFKKYSKGHAFFVLHGSAGTGKSYIALANALREVLTPGSEYKKVIIMRSAVPSRAIGDLPGDEKEKTEVYLQPYKEMAAELFPRFGEKAYTKLKEQGYIDFRVTSYIRGITLDNAIVIVDEFQSMNFHEISSVVTRIGENAKLILCGDFRQTDLFKKYDKSGLPKFMIIASHMDCFEMIEFDINDIVRSAFVKNFLVATMECEDMGLLPNE